MSITETDERERRKKALAARLRTVRAESNGPAPRPEDATVPLTSAQRRLWISDRMGEPSAAYAVGFGLRLRGALDLASIDEALTAVVARHDVLRARFPADEEGDPSVVIADPIPVEAALSVLDGEQDPLAAAERVFTVMLATPFDLADGPLVRFQVGVLGAEDHVLLATMHHIVADGWSIELIKDGILRALQQARSGELADLGVRPLQYEDIAVWEESSERRSARERDVEHWCGSLAGVESLELDLARPRPATLSGAGRTVEFRLDAQHVAALRALAAQEGATLYMGVLALYQLLLSRHGGRRPFAIGTSVANRDQLGVEDVVGTFVNMIALRADLSGDPSFRELVRRSRSVALEAYTRQSVPFDDIVRALAVPRVPNTTPVFQVSLAVDELASAVGEVTSEVAGLTIEEIGATTHVAHFDLGLHLFAHEGGYVASLTGRTELFDEAALRTLADRLAALLAAVVAAPDAPVDTLPALDEGERVLVLETWARGREDTVDDDTTLADLLFAQRTDSERIAVEHGGRRLSAAELYRSAEAFAVRLAARGVGPETRVAVALDDAVDAAVSILGVLRAGGAYLPLDPSMPAARLKHILSDSGALLCIHDGTLASVPASAEAVSYAELVASPETATLAPEV